MKLYILSFLACFLLSGRLALAKDVQVRVNGMVCGFCAQGIQKKLTAEPTVERVKVSLERKLVTVSLKDGQDLPDTRITELLKASGYSVEKIDRR